MALDELRSFFITLYNESVQSDNRQSTLLTVWALARLLRAPAANSERKHHVLSFHPCSFFPRNSLLGLACGTTDGGTLSNQWLRERHELFTDRRLPRGRHQTVGVRPRIERRLFPSRF